MEINNNLLVQSLTIEKLYKYYKDEKLLVNRRYQRKLVWTVEEKEAFIDSISIDYPVPIFLVAEVTYQGEQVYEIIDGMQRLNAIMDFLEGEYPLHGKYFNMDSVASIKLLKDQGVLKQRKPVLSADTSAKIAGYSIPLSVANIPDPTIIDDVFKRINSCGKHLSAHEIRQAGATNRFGHLVRTLSEAIRRDVSHSDILTLNNMKQISINNRKLHYGIDMGGIFWRMHNIITSDNIRDSKDEELVAHLLGAILINPRPSATSNNLDSFYAENETLEKSISQQGEDVIIIRFQAVLEEFRKIFEAVPECSFYKVLFKEETKYVNRSFQVFFLALYDLLVIKQLKIDDYEGLCNSLIGIGDKYLTPNVERYKHSSDREKGITVIKGFIEKYCSRRNDVDPALSNGVTRIKTIISRSVTENTNYDFKIGFHRLYKQGDFDEDCLKKILKTLTAMANQGKDSIGYVIIGIADDLEDAKRFSLLYGEKTLQYKNFHIGGVQEEAKKYKNIEAYRNFIEDKIRRNTYIEERYTKQILRNIDFVKYYDRAIIVMRLENEGEAIKFDGRYYERQGTNTEIVEKEALLWKRFFN